MIELRRARPGEEAAVASLWNQVFGDDETFLADFYRLCVPVFRRRLALFLFDIGLEKFIVAFVFFKAITLVIIET